MRCQAGRPVLGQWATTLGQPQAKIMATYQVQWPCQKVSECLYIILPSYNMCSITFWHNSALAFILGWWPYEMSSRPASSRPVTNLGLPRYSTPGSMSYRRLQWNRWFCQYVDNGLAYITPSEVLVCIVWYGACMSAKRVIFYLHGISYHWCWCPFFIIEIWYHI